MTSSVRTSETGRCPSERLLDRRNMNHRICLQLPAMHDVRCWWDQARVGAGIPWMPTTHFESALLALVGKLPLLRQ